MTSLDRQRLARTVIVIIITICLGLSSIMMFTIGMADGVALSEDSRYDPSSGQAEIIVDYGTYVGGGDLDGIVDVAVGPGGYIYFAGRTTSEDFPTTEFAVNRSNNGWNDVFVCKFSPDGRDLVYSTYWGGTDGEFPAAIAVDERGCAYVVGTTRSSDFPTTPGCLQEVFGNISDAFVFKLSPDGDRMEFSTYLGGARNEGAEDVVYDRENEVCIVVGYTQSSEFPTTPGAYDTNVNGWDAFVSGFSTDGTSLHYSTLLGDQAQDRAQSVALDPSGNIVVSGFSSDNYDFPVTVGAYQVDNAGGNDGFVAVLNDQATRLLRSTYLGGNGDEVCEKVAVLQNGDIAVIGETGSSNFPTSPDAFDGSFGGGWNDAYLSILNDDLTDLVYSTYLGGQNNEYHGGLVADGHGTVYVSGSSDSPFYPTTENAIQENSGGDQDFIIFVLETSTYTPLLSTYCGGRTVDRASGMALGNNGSLIVPGFSTSYNFPVTGDAFQPNHDVHWDGAFVIIPDIVPPKAHAGEDVIIDQHETVEFNASDSEDNVRITKWTWRFDNGSGPIDLIGSSQTYTFHDAGQYIVTLNVTDSIGNWAMDRINVTVRDITPPMARIICPVMVDQNELIHIDGTSSIDNVGITSWIWTINDSDGPHQEFDSSIEHSFAEVGTYEISLRVADEMENWATAYHNITVIDITPPIADAGSNVEIDQHETITLDGHGSTDNVGIVNWTWHIPEEIGSGTVYGPIMEITIDEPGTYSIVLVVMDAMTNEGTDMVTITVRDITPPVADAGEDKVIDQHEKILFDGPGTSDNVGITGWEWELYYEGTIHRYSDPSFEFTFDEVGEYTVHLTVTDAAGNSANDQVSVTVTDITPPEAFIGPPVYVDQNEIISLDAVLSIDNVGIVNYTWSLFVIDGSDVVKYGRQVSYVIADVGDHGIRLVVKDAAGNLDTDSVEIHVFDITPPVAIIEVDRNRTKEGGMIAFDGTASEDNVVVVNWMWTFMYRGERITLDEAISSFRFDKPGDYEITLTVEDAEGNKGSTSTTVTVDADVQSSSSSWLYLAIALIVIAVVVVAIVAMRQSRD